MRHPMRKSESITLVKVECDWLDGGEHRVDLEVQIWGH